MAPDACGTALEGGGVCGWLSASSLVVGAYLVYSVKEVEVGHAPCRTPFILADYGIASDDFVLEVSGPSPRRSG